MILSAHHHFILLVGRDSQRAGTQLTKSVTTSYGYKWEGLWSVECEVEEIVIKSLLVVIAQVSCPPASQSES